MAKTSSVTWPDEQSDPDSREKTGNLSPQEPMMQGYSALKDQKVSLLLFAALVRKLDGHTEITQADIDAVAYQMLDETIEPDGSISLRLRNPTAN